MVSLINLDSKTSNIRLIGGLMVSEEGFCVNYNCYSIPVDNRFNFPCLLLLILLSTKYPPVHMNGTLEISIYIFYTFKG